MEQIGKITRIVNEAVIYDGLTVEDADKIEALLKEIETEQLRLHVVSISLLKKYMQHVENCEGVNFVSDIGRDWSGIEFSKEEKALLEKLDAEIEQSNEC
jgi:hypothetical protein